MDTSKKALLTPVAGAIAAVLNPAQQALAQDSNENMLLEEVTVTATKRATSVQDIAATVQAITAESLAQMGARAMDDYSRFIPSMSVLTFGAGSTTVVFRGAITGQGYIAQSTSSVYLDEMSLTTTGSQPGIRMVDIERVEALSGPQGTLYGSDAQAGTLRIITNKPVMNTYEAVVDLSLKGGSQSDASYQGSVMFNIPLIEDTLAVRLVGFADRDGGYIDNVLGHTPDTNNNGTAYPAGFGTLDNRDSVEKRWNDAEIHGGRAILEWEINENWTTQFTALTQNTKAGAANDFDPFVGDLKTVRFHNEKRDDDYQMYSFVVDGDLGFAQLVGSVNYYDREIKALYDITAYAHYWAGIYCHDSYYTSSDLPYYWTNPETGYVVWWPVYCQGENVDSDFFSSYPSPAQQDKFTTEWRLSHQGEKIDWIVGFYYEDSNDSWQAPFAQPTDGGNGKTNNYQNSQSLAYWEWYWSNYYGEAATYPEATSHWYSQSSTDWKQKAVFGEFTWHIGDSWDLTFGGRYFKRDNTNYYIVDHPGDLGHNGEPDPADPTSRAYRLEHNGQPPPHKQSENDFIPKVSLAWNFGDDKMIYGLYTQGTRPGGINRARGQPFFPINYLGDKMDNYELGYRSTFAGGNGRFNATYYHMKWKKYQIELVDPASQNCPDGGEVAHVCGQPWQQVVGNAGDAHINGLNLELDYAFNENWIFGGNFEFNEAETDSTLDLDGDGDIDLEEGQRLPVSPKRKGSAWLDYNDDVNWFGGGKQFFARLQVSYTGSSYSVLEPRGLDDPNPQFKTGSYTIADIRLGLRGSDWEVSMFLNNFTDERAIYTIQDGLFEWGMGSQKDGRSHLQRAYTNRPRELGIRFTKSWGG